MKLIISIVILALSMSTAQAQPNITVDQSRLTLNRTRLNIDTKLAIDALRKSCHAPGALMAFDHAVDIAIGDVQDLQEAARNSLIHYDDLESVARKNRELGQAYGQYVFDVLSIVADYSLQRGCLDVADKYYRSIVNIFTGTSYASYRQRAQIGIDDVRSRRSSRAR
jgi:hypothetical protein